MNKRRGEVEEEPSQKRRGEGARKEGKRQALLPCWGMQVLSLLLSPWRRLSQPRRAEEAKGSEQPELSRPLSLPQLSNFSRAAAGGGCRGCKLRPVPAGGIVGWMMLGGPAGEEATEIERGARGYRRAPRTTPGRAGTATTDHTSIHLLIQAFSSKQRRLSSGGLPVSLRLGPTMAPDRHVVTWLSDVQRETPFSHRP